MKYGNGLLVQWGTATFPGEASGGKGFATINFPKIFANTSYTWIATNNLDSQKPLEVMLGQIIYFCILSVPVILYDLRYVRVQDLQSKLLVIAD